MAEVNGNDQHLSGLRVMLSAAVGSIFLFFWVSNCDWGRFFLLNFFFSVGLFTPVRCESKDCR